MEAFSDALDSTVRQLKVYAVCIYSVLLCVLGELFFSFWTAQGKTFIVLICHSFCWKQSLSDCVCCWVSISVRAPPPQRHQQPLLGLLSVWSQNYEEFKQQRGVAPLRLCLCLHSLPYNRGHYPAPLCLCYRKKRAHITTGEELTRHYIGWWGGRTHSEQITQTTAARTRGGPIRQGWGKEARRKYNIHPWLHLL